MQATLKVLQHSVLLHRHRGSRSLSGAWAPPRLGLAPPPGRPRPPRPGPAHRAPAPPRAAALRSHRPARGSVAEPGPGAELGAAGWEAGGRGVGRGRDGGPDDRRGGGGGYRGSRGCGGAGGGPRGRRGSGARVATGKGRPSPSRALRARIWTRPARAGPSCTFPGMGLGTATGTARCQVSFLRSRPCDSPRPAKAARGSPGVASFQAPWRALSSSPRPRLRSHEQKSRLLSHHPLHCMQRSFCFFLSGFRVPSLWPPPHPQYSPRPG